MSNLCVRHLSTAPVTKTNSITTKADSDAVGGAESVTFEGGAAVVVRFRNPRDPSHPTPLRSQSGCFQEPS